MTTFLALHQKGVHACEQASHPFLSQDCLSRPNTARCPWSLFKQHTFTKKPCRPAQTIWRTPSSYFARGRPSGEPINACDRICRDQQPPVYRRAPILQGAGPQAARPGPAGGSPPPPPDRSAPQGCHPQGGHGREGRHPPQQARPSTVPTLSLVGFVTARCRSRNLGSGGALHVQWYPKISEGQRLLMRESCRQPSSSLLSCIPLAPRPHIGPWYLQARFDGKGDHAADPTLHLHPQRDHGAEGAAQRGTLPGDSKACQVGCLVCSGTPSDKLSPARILMRLGR